MSRAQLTSTVEQNTGGAVAPFVAGKNAIINGDFYVNQRGFTSTTSSGYVLFDRFSNYVADGTVTYSNQTFTAGAAPVSGYEGKSFIQSAVSGQTAAGAASFFSQKIENVRTLAGQTATLSFWAKAASGTPKIAFEYTQSFGTGGSPSSAVTTASGTATLSTSWARYSINIAIPSLSGKTIGTTDGTSYLEIGFWLSAGSSFASRASSIGIQNNTIGVWGVQLEAGSVATSFTTATGTLSGELAACQRYYWRTTGSAGGYYAMQQDATARGYNFVTDGLLKNPVPMRTVPTSIDYGSGHNLEPYYGSGAAKSITTITLDTPTSIYNTGVQLSTSSAFSASTRLMWYMNNSSSTFIGVSAEL